MLRNKSRVSQLVAVLGVLALMAGTVNTARADLVGSGWWTSFTLQNPSSSASVNILLLDANVVEGGDTTKDTSSSGQCPIKPGASVIFNPGFDPNYKADGTGGTRIGFGANCESGNLSSGFQGGAVVSSNGPLVSVVSIGNNKSGTAGTDGGTASAFYQGMSTTANTLLFPVAKNGVGGQTTTYFIQAVSDASITVTYSDGETQGPLSISAGRTRIISMPPAMVNNAVFAATVTSSSGQIAGSVVEHPTSANPATFALSTRAFIPDEANTTVYAPALKNDFSGGTTGLAVQAVGGDVTVVVDFAITNQAAGVTCTAGSSDSVPIQSGKSVVFGGPSDKNLPAGFINGCFGSGTVRVTGGSGKIVATVNETNSSGKAVYSGFPATAASQKVAVPLVKEAFANGNTAVVVQAVGSSGSSTAVQASYVNNAACASGCVVTPNGGGAGPASLSGGSANNFRRLNVNSAQYNGTLPAEGTNNAVVVSSSALPVVVIAQENVTGLDVKNYEGFKQ